MHSNIAPLSCLWAIRLLGLALVFLTPGLTVASPSHLPNVVATTSIVADTANRLGEGFISITALMGEGVDPHLYKASPGDMRTLSAADLILYNGLHLEGKMAEILEKLAERRTVIAVTRAIPRDRLRVTVEFPDAPDPHVWFDPQLWSYAVTEIDRALSALVPQQATVIHERAQQLTLDLANVEREILNLISAIPNERRVMVTAHDAFGYFGKRFGISVLSVQGMSTDSEASLKEINALVETIVLRRIPAVFVESSVPQKAVEALVQGAAARDHHVVIGGQLYSDALGPKDSPEGTLLGVLRHNGSVISSALRSRTSEERS